VFAPFFANFFALVITLDTTNTFPLVGTVTAVFVIANAVINIREWDVDRLMAFVFTVETGQS